MRTAKLGRFTFEWMWPARYAGLIGFGVAWTPTTFEVRIGCLEVWWVRR